MAMSKPYPTGQFCIVMRCELCNKDVDVNWFCKNCVKNLCNNCKEMHAKIPSCCEHDVGTIGDGRRIDRDVILLCTDHGEVLQYRCKTCVKNVCIKCLNSHLKHEYIDLNEESENIREEFWVLLELKKKELERLNQQRVSIQHHLKEYQTMANMTVAEIESKFNEILKLKESMVREVQDGERIAEKELNEQCKSIEDAGSSLRDKIDKIEDDMGNYDGLYLIHLILKEMQGIQTVQTPVQKSLPMPLVLSKTAAIDAQQIFGTLKVADEVQRTKEVVEGKNTERKLKDRLSVTSSFMYHKAPKTAFSYVRSFFRSDIYDIVCTEDGKAWITGDNMPLQLVDHTGEVHQSIVLTPFAVRLAMSPSGDVMVASRFAQPVDTTIKRISRDGTVSVFAELKHCKFVLALAFDLELDLICLTYNDDSKFQLMKIDGGGKEKWRTVIGDGPRNKHTVCLSPDGNYLVIMGTDIFVVNVEGDIIEKKKISKSLGKVEPVIYDNNGHFIVGTEDGRIHVLSTEMEVLRTYTLEDKVSVLSLDVDISGRLWIGRYDGKVFVAKYVE